MSSNVLDARAAKQ